MDSSVDDYRKK